jgi:hypothetical protein
MLRDMVLFNLSKEVAPRGQCFRLNQAESSLVSEVFGSTMRCFLKVPVSRTGKQGDSWNS